MCQPASLPVRFQHDQHAALVAFKQTVYHNFNAFLEFRQVQAVIFQIKAPRHAKDLILLPQTDLSIRQGLHYKGQHIHLACRAGHLEMVRGLLEADVDVNLRGGVNELTPLHVAFAIPQKSPCLGHG